MRIPHEIKLRAAAEVLRVLEDVNGIACVVIATPDGFEIASASQRHFEPARIAAMASSISAIGAVVSQEARLGRCTCITVATDKGFALVSPVRNGETELVVNVIADANAVLAQVMYRTAACVRVLEAP
ncbi:roadblock/LC7 domain-containing protein [Variovorax sp. CAN2819]|uniref:roadblock/LC7 domain-containing protein n=1 Tax=Variovorax sp. CAN15 TaxID=3046727 RepID=UPI0026481BED|nr:roadblock/LC7 domain-containing protein [Variovorax sp. CAN15]MDN6883187.1 roadblock/LC7 domain-containing protein [Variovorax sp. CAN15]